MKRSKSKDFFKKTKKIIPGGVNSPVRSFSAVSSTPFIVKRSKGSTITDIDNNKYIDFIGSWGAMILGHSDNRILKKLNEVSKNGLTYGAPNKTETEIAKYIVKAIPSIEKIRMVNSGTEATMSAIRLARGYTKRDIIIKFNGCYHGHGDSFLVEAGSGAMTFGKPSSIGVTRGSSKDTISIPYNDENAISKIFNRYKPIGIFNLAAETHVDRSIDGPKSFIESNIVGVFNILEIFRKFSKKNKRSKLIHISTDEVYGDVLNGRSNELYSYNPSSPYAATKASSDHLVSSYVRTFKIPAIVTNCSNNYGPCQHPEKLIPKLIYNILNNIPLPIYGDGKNSREWIFVEDHCDALFQVFKKGKIGEFYNIGSNKNYNNLEITKKLINISSKHIKLGNHVKIKYVKDRPGHDKRYALNSDKINKKLLWKSSTDINEGLKKTIEWSKKNKQTNTNTYNF